MILTTFLLLLILLYASIYILASVAWKIVDRGFYLCYYVDVSNETIVTLTVGTVR